jgi:two-component system chemotaxis response regulator CheB
MQWSELVAPASRDVILIGGSQGSIAALKTVLGGLPSRFHAAIGVTIHRSATVVSRLAEVFSVCSKMPVVEPSHGQRFESGIVYLAPQDHHMILRYGAVWLDRGPKHHFVRPAIDVMFSSGAIAYGPRVIGVLLTGNLSDGVAGLVSIKGHGGLSLVQDPSDAEAPSMPMNAVAYDNVDAMFQVPAGSRVLTKLVAGAGISEATAVDGARRLPPNSARLNSANGGVAFGSKRSSPGAALANELRFLRRR